MQRECNPDLHGAAKRMLRLGASDRLRRTQDVHRHPGHGDMHLSDDLHGGREAMQRRWHPDLRDAGQRVRWMGSSRALRGAEDVRRSRRDGELHVSLDLHGGC